MHNNIECYLKTIKEADSPYQYNEYTIPRVSAILSNCINEDYIPKWANYLGFKRQNYNEVLNGYAEIGTLVHDMVENIILHGYTTIQPPKKYHRAVYNAVNGFVNWFSIIQNNTIYNIEATERELVCPYFGGTCDLIININNKKYLMDFKTSKNISFKHILQLCAYKYILENYYGEIIDGIGLLYLSRDDTSVTEYIFHYDEYKKEIDDMTNIFLSLVNSYYGIYNIESIFKAMK